jgi:hypothetical protein
MLNNRRRARLLLMLAAAAALTACANGEALPEAHGPWWALNPGQWTPTPADLARAPK